MYELRGIVRLGTFCGLVVALSVSWGGPAWAGLAITPAGAAQGLSLSTFADGFSNNAFGSGPLGVAFPTSGGVLVTDSSGNVRLFPSDTDGQHAGSVPVTQFYGANNAVDLAQVGGNIYMTRQPNGDVVQLNNDGTFKQVVVGGMAYATGMIADPANGHLFVSTPNVGPIYEVDPVAKTKSVFLNASVDGLSISADGAVLYGARTDGHIIGFNTTTKAVVYDSGAIPGGLDGTALGAGSFAGYIFANTNSGQVYEVTLGASPVQTLIATGGSRGDFVTVDPLTNTLLITQTNTLIRLNGASFVTPEPAGLVMMGTAALTLLGAFGWHRRRRAG